MLRVLVCGGRSFRSQVLVDEVLDRVTGRMPCLIIEGGSDGADACAAHWASRHRLPRMVFPANWRHMGRAAGPVRNQWMLDFGEPHLVVAFPGGRGTSHMVEIAKRAGLEVVEVPHAEG